MQHGLMSHDHPARPAAKPPRLTKPRRLYPSSLEPDSAAGQRFWEHILEVVGPRLEYVEIARFGPGHNAWVVDGPRGRGLLAEAEDGPQPGGVFRTRVVFIGHSWSVWP